MCIRDSNSPPDAAETVLEFCASDSGIGIKQDKLDMIFDTFCQADGSTTRKYGGTGLGLSISRRLVNLMGGDMWVRSHLGKGSDFFFTMVVRRDKFTTEQLNERMHPYKGRKVLFLDTKGEGADVTRMIDQLGLKPIVFHTLNETMQHSSSFNRIDAIVTDVLYVVSHLSLIHI